MNPDRPLVSVVIPCYNARRWIAATLDSVHAQTWRPLEIVVVDDGSTDGSGPWLQAQADAGRIRLLQQPNRGQTAALNAGVALSRGQWLQFLDADDLLDPEKIERQMARIAGDSDVVASAEWARFHGEDPALARFEPEPCWRDLAPADWLAAAWRDGGGMLFPALWLVPRELVLKAGPWDESLSLNNDAEFFVRVLRAAREVRFAAGARARYRSGVPGSMSSRVDPRAWGAYLRALERIDAHVADWAHAGVRRGLSLCWQRFARGAYPYTPELAEQALRRARELDDAVLPTEGGWRYRLLSACIGWRATRRLQVWSGRL
jgi:glycosyltransferase involved in cell wall biosynthesis